MGGTGGSDPVGGSGGQSMAGSGGTPPVMVCEPKATQCANGSFETCKDDGSGWTSEACDFVCHAQKGCVGACTPGDKECDGLKSQTCDETGTWIVVTTCPFVCGGKGVCGGQCVPGTEQCSGTNAQQCEDGVSWETTESCDFVCNFSGGSASCAGSCTNGTKQCSGKVPQTCTSNVWSNGTVCPYICSNGTCAGECIPGTSMCGPQGGIQSCSAQGIWTAEGATCPFTCIDGSCAGICVPDGSCPDDGNSCTNDVCNAQGTACLHPKKTNGALCGAGASSDCDDADSCQNGTCQQNLKATNTACTSDNNACTSDMCNGSGTCAHSAVPANTVCRAATCSDGTSLASETTCGGATTCPPPSVKTCPDDPDLNRVGACVAGSCTLECAVDFDDCTSAPGCESDLRVTSDHCGSCERTCIDGQCSDSLCQPNPFVTGRQNNGIYRLAIDSDNLYWTETVGNVVRVGIPSGTPTPLATNQVQPRWITLVGGVLYWSVTGNMMAMQASGGTATPVFAAAQAGMGGTNAPATSDGSYVYWSNASGKVQRALVSNAATSDVVNPDAHGYSFVSSLAASAGTVFLSLMDPGNRLMKATTGLASDFAVEQPNVADMSVYGSYLYWTTLGANWVPATGTVNRVSIAGGSVATIASSQVAPNQITSDGTYVYWTTTSTGTPQIQKAPVGGGPIDVVTDLTSYAPSSRSNLVVGAQHLYWVASSEVIKVAK